MCSYKGYDIHYYFDKVSIEPHFCRCPDCGGGLTLDAACEIVAQYFEDQAKAVREHRHPMLVEYVDDNGEEWHEQD